MRAIKAVTGRIKPAAALYVTAATAWAAAITSDFLGASMRAWLPLLAVAVTTTQTALHDKHVAKRIDRAYLAMTRAVTGRPDDPAMTPAPWPALRAVQPARPHTQRGKHANAG